MKTFAIIFSMMTLITFSGYSQSKDVKKLLDKPETRTEIFNSIMENHELMTEFMTAMKGNEHAMMMMKQSDKGMGHEGNMSMGEGKQGMDHSKMMENPEMKQQMMSNMMQMCKKDSTMRGNMADMMTNNPEMMQAMMQKMKDKGMMDKNGCMKMMHNKDKGENSQQQHKH